MLYAARRRPDDAYVGVAQRPDRACAPWPRGRGAPEGRRRIRHTSCRMVHRSRCVLPQMPARPWRGGARSSRCQRRTHTALSDIVALRRSPRCRGCCVADCTNPWASVTLLRTLITRASGVSSCRRWPRPVTLAGASSCNSFVRQQRHAARRSCQRQCRLRHRAGRRWHVARPRCGPARRVCRRCRRDGCVVRRDRHRHAGGSAPARRL